MQGDRFHIQCFPMGTFLPRSIGPVMDAAATLLGAVTTSMPSLDKLDVTLNGSHWAGSEY